MSTFLGILFAVGAALSWGTNSHVLRRGAREEHPLLALIYRAIFSFPILIAITVLKRNWNYVLIFFSPNLIWWTLLLVLSIIIGDGLFIFALRKYPVSTILPIAACYPLITSGVLVLFGVEHFTVQTFLGTITVVSGIFIVTRYQYGMDHKRTGLSLEPLLMGLGVAIGWGGSVIFARVIFEYPGTESFGLMSVRTALIGLVATIAYFGSKSNRDALSQQTWSQRIKSFKVFALSGLLGWVLGATLLFLALEEIGATVATPISASNPVIAVIIGQLTGIDRINLIQFTGIATTTIGVILIIL